MHIQSSMNPFRWVIEPKNQKKKVIQKEPNAFPDMLIGWKCLGMVTGSIGVNR